MSDREFLKLFTGLMGALAAVTLVLFVLAQMASKAADNEVARADTKAVAERIKPVGEVEVSESPRMELISSANAAAGDKGKAAYEATCAACHTAGVAGAPKLADKAVWKDRIAKGKEALYQSSLKGVQGKSGFMPPKGGNPGLPDADVKAAVDYMVAQGK